MPKRKFPVKMGGVSARVPERVLNEIKRIVFIEGYKDVADYMRELIREDFKKRGITFKKKVGKRLKEAKKEKPKEEKVEEEKPDA